MPVISPTRVFPVAVAETTSWSSPSRRLFSTARL